MLYVFICICLQSATSFLQYLDVSVGKEVAAICTKTGRLDAMCQNPNNAIIHLGHHNGTVTLWSPNQKEALVKMLCHQGAVRSVAVDKAGTWVTQKLHILHVGWSAGAVSLYQHLHEAINAGICESNPEQHNNIRKLADAQCLLCSCCEHPLSVQHGVTCCPVPPFLQLYGDIRHG